MDRAVPTSSNRHLKKIWGDHLQDLHKEKLKKIKSRIDSKSPCRYTHLFNNAKKEQNLEGNNYSDRYTEIERENRLLLEKMNQIVKQGYKSSSNVNKSLVVKHSKKRNPSLKIYKENQILVKRLQSQSSVYRLAKFEESNKEHEDLLNRISEYPYRLTKNQSFFKPLRRKRKSQKDKIVYMKNVNISEKKLEIEIYKSGNMMVVLAFDDDEVHKLSIFWIEALKLMETSLNYDKIIERLHFEKDNLVLLS